MKTNGLELVKPGDAVALVSHVGYTGRINAQKGIVERVTKTQVIAFGGRKFIKLNGTELGRSAERFSIPDCLSVLTPELVAKIEESKAITEAERTCFEWHEILQRARGKDALSLAKMLPALPPQGTPTCSTPSPAT
jgi:hypothetical protein